MFINRASAPSSVLSTKPVLDNQIKYLLNKWREKWKKRRKDNRHARGRFQLSFAGKVVESMNLMGQTLLLASPQCAYHFLLRRSQTAQERLCQRAPIGSAGTCSGSRWMRPIPCLDLTSTALYPGGMCMYVDLKEAKTNSLNSLEIFDFVTHIQFT